jgi:hypothetical protein
MVDAGIKPADVIAHDDEVFGFFSCACTAPHTNMPATINRTPSSEAMRVIETF